MNVAKHVMSPDISNFLNHLPAVESPRFFRTSNDQGVTSLLYLLAKETPLWKTWPNEFREELESLAQVEAARELLRQQELIRILSTLAKNEIEPLLMKGTPLAYSYYETASARPRCDTDLLIRKEDAQRVKEILTQLGYTQPNQSAPEILFGQFILEKIDRFENHHILDFHLEFSCRKLFANIMTYPEFRKEATKVPLLGNKALALGPQHALFVACIHPVMHHRHEQRLIWVYDIHLVASRMTAIELKKFLEMAQRKKARQICEEALLGAQRIFGTSLPNGLLTGVTGEPSSTFLRKGRRWHHEILSDLQALSSWSQRGRLLKEIILPNPDYLLKSYFPDHWRGASWGGRVLLKTVVPFLYLYRGILGLFRWATGQKR